MLFVEHSWKKQILRVKYDAMTPEPAITFHMAKEMDFQFSRNIQIGCTIYSYSWKTNELGTGWFHITLSDEDVVSVTKKTSNMPGLPWWPALANYRDKAIYMSCGDLNAKASTACMRYNISDDTCV